jgi:hypothetical protein
MTLYPNIIYHADTSTEIFIDTLQAIDNTANADVVTYQSSIDGSLGTFNRGIGARQLTLNGKISEDNETELRRQLQYLRGKQIYLMLGARNIATLARIKSFDMPVKGGTYTSLTLDVECETETEGQFWEAEDCTTDGTDHSQTIASGGKCVYLNSGGESVQIRIEQSDIVLPLGNYKMFARVYDANNVTDDFALNVFNDDDTSMVDSTTVTLTSAYETYAIVTADFEITSDEEGDDLIIYVKKNTGTSNIIYVDFLGFVRTD